MRYSVLLVGAGQLGSRYLQGLVKCKSCLDITVVDPSVQSLKISNTRWIEAAGDIAGHNIFWATSFPKTLTEVDVVIVATSSAERAELVQKIASHINVRFWILEKVLARSSAEVEDIEHALVTCEGAWVNTPRRMMPWYKSMRKAISGSGQMHGSLSAGLWGLACNSIHFIDLMSWWSGETLSAVEVTDLDSYWFESKRAGYFEVTGSLVARFSTGSTLLLQSTRVQTARPLVVKTCCGTLWEIDEGAGLARMSDGRCIPGRLELQSELSGRLINDLVSRGDCDLPRLQESARMHSIFLDAMLGHWNKSTGRNDEVVPIT